MKNDKNYDEYMIFISEHYFHGELKSNMKNAHFDKKSKIDKSFYINSKYWTILNILKVFNLI